MNAKSKLTILGIVLIVVIAIGVYGITKRVNSTVSQPTEPYTIKVAYGKYVSPIFVAVDKGFFDEQGLKIEMHFISGPDTIMAGLASGDIDVAAPPYNVLFAFEKASPGKFKIFGGIVETIDKPSSYLIVKDYIHDAKELIGQKIVIRSGSNGRLQAEMVLQGLGIDPASVTFVPVDTQATAATFAGDDIAAAIDIQPSAAMMIQKEKGIPLIAGVRPRFIINPYPSVAQVFSAKFVTEHPVEAEKFRLALEKAIDYIASNNAEYKSILQNYLNLDANTVAAISLSEFQKLDNLDRDAIQKLMEFQIQSKDLDNPIDLSNVYYEQP